MRPRNISPSEQRWKCRMVWQVSVAGSCGRGRPRPRTVCNKIACRASTDFMCDLGRIQRALHIRGQHSVHLDVKELSPLQDMSALAAFMAHADFSQDSCRCGVANDMAC